MRDVQDQSPPVRGRGLKRGHALHDGAGGDVAPRAGAWIETVGRSPSTTRARVAPRAGAWIETAARSPTASTARASPPVRGRGLKQAPFVGLDATPPVAPRAGAWIETSC